MDESLIVAIDEIDSLAPSVPSDEFCLSSGTCDYDFRLAQHLPVLREALRSVYGSGSACFDLIERLKSSMATAYVRRPARLRARDLDRLRHPDWFQRPDQFGYSLYVDRFAGSFAGLIDAIPHLERLGITYLHLLPLYVAQPGANDDGFAVVDHRDLDPRLGTKEDLTRLAFALDDAGITLCLDVVCNHTARDHAWAKRARAGDPEFQARYHLIRDAEFVARLESDLGEVFPLDAPGNFTHEPDLDGWIWTTFYPFQWDLNYANPRVFEELVDVVLTLANLGAGALRLDAAAYIWKQMETNCKGLPEAHALLRALRAVLAIVAPGTLLKAEAIEPGAKAAAYFGGGTECQLAYHNSLMALLWAMLAGGSVGPWRRVIADLPLAPHGSAWILYLRCHDEIGWDVLEPFIDGSPLVRRDVINRITDTYEGRTTQGFGKGIAFQTQGGARGGTNGMLASLVGLPEDDPAAVDLSFRRIGLLYATLFAFPGLPVLWMGDEIGLTNAPLSDVGDSRSVQRPVMDGPRLGHGCEFGALSERILALTRHLIAVRGRCPAFHTASPMSVLNGAPDAVLALSRGGGETRIIVLSNFSSSDVTIDWRWLVRQTPCLELIDAIEAKGVPTEADLVLTPYQVMWLEQPETGS